MHVHMYIIHTYTYVHVLLNHGSLLGALRRSFFEVVLFKCMLKLDYIQHIISLTILFHVAGGVGKSALTIQLIQNQ